MLVSYRTYQRYGWESDKHGSKFRVRQTNLCFRCPHEKSNVAVLFIIQQRPHLLDEHIIGTQTVWIHLEGSGAGTHREMDIEIDRERRGNKGVAVDET